jgi:hypothetical protein
MITTGSRGMPKPGAARERPLSSVLSPLPAALLVEDVLGCSLGSEGKLMRRRQFIALAGAALVGMTQANATKSLTIGYLALLPGEDRMSFMARFMRRLDEAWL